MQFRAVVTLVALTLAPTAFAARDTTVIPDKSERVIAIQKRGSLRVAVLNEYPWLKATKAGSSEPFEGAAWVLAKAYARRLEVSIETVPVSFTDKVAILDAGGADITIAPLLQTADREGIVDFIPYSAAAHCAFGRADNPKLADARSLDDLNRSDITVGYINNTPQGAWLKQKLAKAKSDGVPGSLADLATAEVLAGRADVAPIDKYFFAGLSKQHPELITVPKGNACMASEELSIPIAMAIAKGQPAFLAWLRGVAKSIKPDVDEEHTRVVRSGP